jgi:hypothetical protein
MSTNFSIGAMNQLGDALEKAGFTADDLTKLKQFSNLKGVRDVLNGKAEITYPVYPWREENGVIYFSVISDGTTGEQWITRLEAAGYRVSDYAKSILRSKKFQPTTNVKTEVAVLKGEIFTDENRITKKIRLEAKKRNLAKAKINAEVACLTRIMFSDEDIKAIGLWWIVVMHEPIKDSDGNPMLLGAYRINDGHWLDTCYDRPDSKWFRSCGFAFAVSQVVLVA